MWLFDRTSVHDKSVTEKYMICKACYKYADKRYCKGKYWARNRLLKTARKNFTEAKNEVRARDTMTEDERRRHT